MALHPLLRACRCIKTAAEPFHAARASWRAYAEVLRVLVLRAASSLGRLPGVRYVSAENHHSGCFVEHRKQLTGISLSISQFKCATMCEWIPASIMLFNIELTAQRGNLFRQLPNGPTTGTAIEPYVHTKQRTA